MLKAPTLTYFLLPPPTSTPTNISFAVIFPTKKSHFRPFTISKTLTPLFSSSSDFSFPNDDEEEHVVGDCLIFEEDAFDDPFPKSGVDLGNRSRQEKKAVSPQNLVPEGWEEVRAEINRTKKEKRVIAKQLEFGSRVQKRKGTGLPPVTFDKEAYQKRKVTSLPPVTLDTFDTEAYVKRKGAGFTAAASFAKSYRSTMLSRLKPLYLEKPTDPLDTGESVKTTSDRDGGELARDSSVRVAPKDPRLAVADSSLKDVADFFNSPDYQPSNDESKNSQGRRQLFTAEEKILLNKKLPNLADATSRKWLPLHTLAASGEFYLMNKLLKHVEDINTVDKDGLTALHKAILGKKMAIANYLLRESANPFVLDKGGATLLHYAVQVASSSAVKILLLYNVDINLSDDDGWTPLHLAVQTKRTDMVKLLLIKGANKTLRNKDGLTPLELCLHLGHDVRTYELIKLLKELPRSK